MSMPEDPNQLHTMQHPSLPAMSSMQNLGQNSISSIGSSAEKPKKKTAYSMFMVAEAKRIRAMHPELSHAELMKLVGDAV